MSTLRTILIPAFFAFLVAFATISVYAATNSTVAITNQSINSSAASSGTRYSYSLYSSVTGATFYINGNCPSPANPKTCAFSASNKSWVKESSGSFKAGSQVGIYVVPPKGYSWTDSAWEGTYYQTADPTVITADRNVSETVYYNGITPKPIKVSLTSNMTSATVGSPFTLNTSVQNAVGSVDVQVLFANNGTEVCKKYVWSSSSAPTLVSALCNFNPKVPGTYTFNAVAQDVGDDGSAVYSKIVSVKAAYAPVITSCSTLKEVHAGQNLSCSNFTAHLTGIIPQQISQIGPYANLSIYYNGQPADLYGIVPGTVRFQWVPSNQSVLYYYQGKYAYITTGDVVNGASVAQKYSDLALYPTNQPTSTAACNKTVQLYLSSNITCGGITAQLSYVQKPVSNVISPQVTMSIYNNGTLTNLTQSIPGTVTAINSSGTLLFLNVSSANPSSNPTKVWAKASVSIAPAPHSTYACDEQVTVYIGYNVSCENFKLEMTGMTQPGANGTSQVFVELYNNGLITNLTTLSPVSNVTFDSDNSIVSAELTQTLYGLYAYQKWAQIGLYPINSAVPGQVIGPFGIGQTVAVSNLSVANITASAAVVDQSPSGELPTTTVVTQPVCVLTNQQVWLRTHSTVYGPFDIGQKTVPINNLTVLNVTGQCTGTQGSNTVSVENLQVYFLKNGNIILPPTNITSAVNYNFDALIGSVLNGGLVTANSIYSKQLQDTFPFAYIDSRSLLVAQPSPYAGIGMVPANPVPQVLGGGVSFTGFSSNGYDNIMPITSQQLPSLASNYGANGESEEIWLAGFPVFDQATGVNNFRLLSATGAYQATFGIPIQINGTATAQAFIAGNLNKQIKLLGLNYTILRAYGSPTPVDSSNTVIGGGMTLGAVLTQPTTVYLDHNVTSGPFTVQLEDLGQPNSNGAVPAIIDIYYNGQLTNQTSAAPGTVTEFTVSGNNIFVNVQGTLAGLYAVDKWAKLQLYSNVFNITSGEIFNVTNDPGWYTLLYWTNTTSSTSGNAVALKSIVVYNTTPTSLAPGQSFSFIQDPSPIKLTFTGDTSTASDYDSVSAAVSTYSTITYQNLGRQATGVSNITNITEPTSMLVVQSTIPDAFSYAGQTSSSVLYDLTPYKLQEYGNANSASDYVPGVAVSPGNSVIVLNVSAPGSLGKAGQVRSDNPLTVQVTGYASAGASAPVTESATFLSDSSNVMVPALYSVTGIELSRSVLGRVTVSALSQSLQKSGDMAMLAQLSNVTNATILYNTNGSYLHVSTLSTNVIYNTQNGQPETDFTLKNTPGTYVATSTAGAAQYYTYTINEYPVPGSTGYTDSVSFGIVNSTVGADASPLFQLNYSASASTLPGTKDNITYVSSQGHTVIVPLGFITERGTKFTGYTNPSQIDIQIPKVPDQLNFVVTQTN